MALVWDFSTLASTTSQTMYMEHETALKQNDTSMPPHGSVRVDTVPAKETMISVRA